MQKEEERRTSEEDDITEAGVRTKENIWKPCVLSTIGKETYHFVGHEISIWESLDSFGSVIWPAAITLCQYLESNQALVNLFDKAVLEIGSGTGLVSIVASLLGAWVTSTDLPEVLGNLRSNLSRNTRGRCRYTPQVAELSWGHELEKTFPHSVYKYDYILAADVVYHHDFLQELLVTMCHFCQPGSTLIWANKVRFNSDLLFLERFQNTFNTCLLADNGEVKILSATMKDDSKPELLRPIIRLEKAEGQTDQDDWQSSRKTRREMNAEEEFQQQAMVVAAEDNIMDDAGEILEEQEKNIDGEKSSGSTETDLPQRSIDNEEEEEEEEEGREEVVKGEDEDYKEEEEEDEEEEESRLKNKKESLWEPVIYFKPGKEIYHFLGQEITIQESIDSYGATVWPAALTLCQYLESPLGRQKIQLLDRSVLELGAGTGLLSVVATLLGAKVTATDLPEILNNLTYNLNKNTRGLWRHQPQVKDLHWGHKLQENFSNSTQHYDFVLASDVVYHHSFLSELLVTMHHFCQQGSCLIWANKVRYASDLTFIKRFLQTFDTTLLEEIDEVRIYSATSKP